MDIFKPDLKLFKKMPKRGREGFRAIGWPLASSSLHMRPWDVFCESSVTCRSSLVGVLSAPWVVAGQARRAVVRPRLAAGSVALVVGR